MKFNFGFNKSRAKASSRYREAMSSDDGYGRVDIVDRGNEPAVMNLDVIMMQNDSKMRTVWTGEKMQVTVMNIPVGGEMGLEAHSGSEQYIRIESGSGEVTMGDAPDRMTMKIISDKNYGIFVPRGRYHNIKNIGRVPLKLISVYAPREHRFGTVEE